jgi:hypothetical protein
MNPLIKRNVEERKVFGPGSWQVGWGEFQWMLIAAGAQHPRDKDLNYIDAALKKPCGITRGTFRPMGSGITRGTFLPTGKVLGLALFQRPPPATTFEKGCASSDGEYIDGDCSSDGEYIDGDSLALITR